MLFSFFPYLLHSLFLSPSILFHMSSPPLKAVPHEEDDDGVELLSAASVQEIQNRAILNYKIAENDPTCIICGFPYNASFGLRFEINTCLNEACKFGHSMCLQQHHRCLFLKQNIGKYPQNYFVKCPTRKTLFCLESIQHVEENKEEEGKVEDKQVEESKVEESTLEKNNE